VLAYAEVSGRGEGDRLLVRVVETLHAEGVRVVGVVQHNVEYDPARPCHMDLRLIDGAQTIRISQNLGPMARGCRLDSDALEQAVAGVEAALVRGGVDLLVINKFGKQECDGRGFRPAIAQALQAGIPVLTSVSARNLAAFEDFAGGMGESVPPDPAVLLGWCWTTLVQSGRKPGAALG
jgi:nucleoside-triphosphatase THEP1